MTALADAFAQPTATAAERLARAVAIIERHNQLDRDWLIHDGLFDGWLDPFLLEVLVADGRGDRDAARLLAWIADYDPNAHFRGVARAALRRST